MFYVIIGPIYRFVRYEMKTKKTRFYLKWLNDEADFIMWKYWEANHSLQRDCLKTKNNDPIYLR